MKKPAGVFAGGLVILFDLSGRLAQAIAVRRHGGPMMMVVAVMAEALHLLSKLQGKPAALSNLLLQTELRASGRMVPVRRAMEIVLAAVVLCAPGREWRSIRIATRDGAPGHAHAHAVRRRRRASTSTTPAWMS